MSAARWRTVSPTTLEGLISLDPYDQARVHCRPGSYPHRLICAVRATEMPCLTLTCLGRLIYLARNNQWSVHLCAWAMPPSADMKLLERAGDNAAPHGGSFSAFYAAAATLLVHLACVLLDPSSPLFMPKGGHHHMRHRFVTA